MSILILGNMNNNGFVWLRYLVDLGIDAKLVLFLDDGAALSSHFGLESDTWNLDRYSDKMVRINFSASHSFISHQSWALKVFFWFIYLVRNILGQKRALYSRPPNKDELDKLQKIIDSSTFTIGSGATPLIMNILGKKLNIFFPYAIGVEYIDDFPFSSYLKCSNPIKKYIATRVKSEQLNGLKKVDIAVVMTGGKTTQLLKDHGINVRVQFMPLVYHLESLQFLDQYGDQLKKALNMISSIKYVFFINSRQYWVRPVDVSESIWRKESKNSNYAILAFERFLRETKITDVRLIICEYGKDVIETKTLVRSLGLEDYVAWLPIMTRKEILVLMRNVFLNIGEFYEEQVLFGSAGFEAMSAGTPLINSFKFKPQEFYEEFGAPSPPILIANSVDEIFCAMKNLCTDEQYYQECALKTIDWYMEHSGLSAARKLSGLINGDFTH